MLAKQKGDKRSNARKPYISLYQKAALEHLNPLSVSPQRETGPKKE
jgi:hypothetical protein